MSVILFFTDNTQKSLDARKASGFKGFNMDLKPDLIPDDPLKTANGVVVKKSINKIQVNFYTGLTIDSKFFKTLDIRQVFLCTALPANNAQHIEYSFTPGGWIDATNKVQIANSSTHPLLDLKELVKNKILINALIVDLTEAWMALHKDNDNYKFILKNLSSDKVTFKVWGNLSSNAFIWYSVIPKHVEKSEKLSPHVFFSPADLQEYQNKVKDKEYLLNNKDYFKVDGRQLMKYLLPPVDDINLTSLQSKMSGATKAIDLKERRNVVNFRFANDKKTLTPAIWHIGAGFEKAFYGITAKPQQIFLMPQDYGTARGTALKGVQTLGPPLALKQITDTILDVLMTNTNLIGKGKDPIVAKDKFVLSCYSESGFDLWFAVQRNLKNIKAIIAIEPQNMNTLTNAYGMNPPLGKNVLPDLQKTGAMIFIIGRHHTQKYKPQNVDLSKIHFLPKDAPKIFKYPPDPSISDFIKYRVQRILDISKDPFALADETNIMAALAAKNPPIKGVDAYNKVFGPLSNLDTAKNNHLGIEAWYSHHFALTGGQVMKLPSGEIYNKAITYFTFFQEAVEKIG